MKLCTSNAEYINETATTLEQIMLATVAFSKSGHVQRIFMVSIAGHNAILRQKRRKWR
jgi:hypothetical protein